MATTHEDIERQMEEIQAKRRKLETDPKPENPHQQVGLLSRGHFDPMIYGASDMSRYDTSIAPNEEDEDEEDRGVAPPTRATYSAPADILNDIPPNELASDPLVDANKQKQIASRLDEYHQRQWKNFIISPARQDPFADVLCVW